MANGRDERISELMLCWEEARKQGKDFSLEEICADHPQLADELRRRIHAVKNMEQVLGVDAEASIKTVPPPTAPRSPERARGEPLPQVPGYEVVRLIAHGGMGEVYEAKQEKLGRTVAVKMITAVRLTEKQIARFQAEAEAAAKLQHPNIVQIFEVGDANGRPFFSMEYIEGGNLAQYIAKNRPSPRSAAELIETLARTVCFAHRQGVVHRDLKPANILLASVARAPAQAGALSVATKDTLETSDHGPPTTDYGLPKVTDFGLAKNIAADDSGQSLTQTGEVLGTPSYMAPEQAEGKKEKIGPRTDVYALGAILYELLAGRPPFQAFSPLESLRMVTSEEPAPPCRFNSLVPRDLEAICLKCLEKTPANRYESADALASDLRRFLDGRSISARRVGPVRKSWRLVKRHPGWAVAAAALLLLAAIPVLYLLNGYLQRRKLLTRAERFAPQAREILHRNCYACHGQDPENTEENLDVLNHSLLLNSHRKIVVPGKPEDSRLIQRIADGSMPPEEKEIRLPRLSEQELTILREWIIGGAPAFPPEDPANPTPPVVPYSEAAARAKQVFHNKCYECHKYDVAKGGIKILHHRLLVTVRKVIVPGRPAESELFQLITSEDEMKMMPPADSEPITEEEIAIIRHWIEAGAPPFPKTE